ncbi:MAG: ATP-binding protein [Pseudomonadota bacterium]
MTLYQRQFAIREMDFTHAGEASVQVKNILKNIGADPDVIRRVAITAYEAEMNAVMYGLNGLMTLELHEDHILIIVEDQGPGIPDVDQAMVEGYSTATSQMREMGFGAGMGLPNIRRNSTEFRVISEPGRGTRLEIVIQAAWRKQQ